MGCECCKRPEEESANLQNHQGISNDFPFANSSLKSENNTSSINRKDSTGNFDPLRNQCSSQYLQPVDITSPTIATQPERDMATSKANHLKSKSPNIKQDSPNEPQAQHIDIPKLSFPEVTPSSIEEIHPIPNNNLEVKEVSSLSTVDSYSVKLIEKINQIRNDPQCFIPFLEEAKTKVSRQNDKLFFCGKVKVQLSQGVDAFDSSIDFLRNAQPLDPLEYNIAYQLEKPTTINEISSNQHMRDNAKKITEVHIDYSYRDLVKDPITTLILAIAGANEKYPNEFNKRNAIFNPDYKYIAITSVTINKIFCAYYTFG